MRLEPDIWIKLRPQAAPVRLEKRVFSALQTQLHSLEKAGLQLVSGHETDWAYMPPQPRDWLSRSYDSVADASFSVVGILVRRRSLRPIPHEYPHLVALPERVVLLTSAVEQWLQAGIPVGGGRDGVEVLFPDVASFSAWAAEGEYPRRHTVAPFSPYPRSPGSGR